MITNTIQYNKIKQKPSPAITQSRCSYYLFYVFIYLCTLLYDKMKAVITKTCNYKTKHKQICNIITIKILIYTRTFTSGVRKEGTEGNENSRKGKKTIVASCNFYSLILTI